MAAFLDPIRRASEYALRRVLHTYWRFQRGMTLGVRGLVVDEAGRIFLVKHSYVRGWHLPGGGVERGETMLDALIRELAEEGNIEPTGPPRLHGMFFNGRVSRRDHVAVYVLRDFRQTAPPTPTARDRRAWLLQARRTAQRHYRWHARAHRRGDGRRAGQRAVVVFARAALASAWQLSIVPAWL